MGTELINSRNIDYSGLSDQEISILQDRLIFEKMARYETAMKQIADRVIKVEKKIDTQVQDMKDNVDTALKIFTKKEQSRNVSSDYGTLADLGAYFDGKIGAIQAGYLLRLCGLAKKDERKTVPYQNCPNMYWRQKLYFDCYGREQYSYVWHTNNCRVAIEKWLKENNLLDDFMLCNSKGKLAEYIRKIYRNHKS